MLKKIKELWLQESQHKEQQKHHYLNRAVDIHDLESRMKNEERDYGEKFFAFYEKNETY